ncbi:DUF4154 domain-containing protein [Sulfurimonas sp. SAG-AH-194-L11]|nr:YfiR/HmsC family protein [Sulfurimonas sp. SAG-AH-194-L11]MDF1877575.1 DUF4154 domain-containing protein [Sulfurimonas sp. SAG-AH-194-L11]
MFKIFRFILIFILFMNPLSISASNYDNDLLNIYSKLMPRFILMSSLKEKLQDKMSLCIVSDVEDEKYVEILIAKSKKNYPHGIKNYEIVFIRSSYENIQECKNTQLAFLFNTNSKNIEHFTLFSHKHTMLTVGYSPETLEMGSDISLFIGRKIQPYINTETIREKNITLENILYRISKIYLEKDE